MTEDATDSGFAAVGVMWSVMILALALAAVTTTARVEAEVSHFAVKRLEGGGIAEAGIDLAILRLLGDDASKWPRLDGEPWAATFAGREIEIRVQDESGKVDMNVASGERLTQLFIGAGLGLDEAQAESDRVLDWREPGDLRRLNGAKRADYEEAGLHYRPRGGPFETVDEFSLVLGVTASVFERLQPLLTVYSELPEIDSTVAPKQVLQAVSTLGDAEIERIVATRARIGGESPAVSPGGTVSLSGHAFRVTARVSLDGAVSTRERVIRLSADNRFPIWTYVAD